MKSKDSHLRRYGLGSIGIHMSSLLINLITQAIIWLKKTEEISLLSLLSKLVLIRDPAQWRKQSEVLCQTYQMPRLGPQDIVFRLDIQFQGFGTAFLISKLLLCPIYTIPTSSPQPSYVRTSRDAREQCVES